MRLDVDQERAAAEHVGDVDDPGRLPRRPGQRPGPGGLVDLGARPSWRSVARSIRQTRALVAFGRSRSTGCGCPGPPSGRRRSRRRLHVVGLVHPARVAVAAEVEVRDELQAGAGGRVVAERHLEDPAVRVGAARRRRSARAAARSSDRRWPAARRCRRSRRRGRLVLS